MTISYLMSSADQVQIMPVEEFANDVVTECEWDSTIILAPPWHVFVWIWPEQVTQQTCSKQI